VVASVCVTFTICPCPFLPRNRPQAYSYYEILIKQVHCADPWPFQHSKWCPWLSQAMTALSLASKLIHCGHCGRLGEPPGPTATDGCPCRGSFWSRPGRAIARPRPPPQKKTEHQAPAISLLTWAESRWRGNQLYSSEQAHNCCRRLTPFCLATFQCATRFNHNLCFRVRCFRTWTELRQCHLPRTVHLAIFCTRE
jgi:hypothetical protein